MGSKTYEKDEKINGHGDGGLSPTSSSVVGELYDPDHPEGTQRGLKSRHAQMIALGGTIGTGLLVGSGQGLRIGGPACFFAGYCLLTILVFGIVRFGNPQAPPHDIKLTDPALGHRYYRNELLSPCPWVDNGLFWNEILVQIDGLRFRLDVLVHLFNHRTSRDHCSRPGCTILASTSQCRCMDHYILNRDHRLELLPSQILWRV